MSLHQLLERQEAQAAGIAFQPWPKIARLRRDMIVTEKIDGTNAAVGIMELEDPRSRIDGAFIYTNGGETDKAYAVYAQSRKRLITPVDDNYGFAAWVEAHAGYLVSILGPGLHFGEWWGEGIQRRYDLDHKRFSLFNVHRWGWLNDPQAREAKAIPDQLWSVPVLKQHTFSTTWAETELAKLRIGGSVAAPGFMRPEGIVVYHTAANAMFKYTIEGDEKGKGE